MQTIFNRQILASDDEDDADTAPNDALCSITFAQLNADSLDKIEILVSVEREFNYEMEDEQYDRFKTVGDIVETILWHPKAV